MRIAVFCGSARGCAEKYMQAARALGKALAQRGHSLVYGGGDEGLMGAAARAAVAAGAEVTAVHTQRFAGHEQVFPVTESIMTETMAERKAVMAGRSDAFIALPGGMGTLDEMTEMFVLTQIGLQQKPVRLLDTDGFYEGLRLQMQRAAADGFMRQEDAEMLCVSDDPETLIILLEQRLKDQA